MRFIVIPISQIYIDDCQNHLKVLQDGFIDLCSQNEGSLESGPYISPP